MPRTARIAAADDADADQIARSQRLVEETRRQLSAATTEIKRLIAQVQDLHDALIEARAQSRLLSALLALIPADVMRRVADKLDAQNAATLEAERMASLAEMPGPRT